MASQYPSMRLRFRGHAASLNTLVQTFRDHPQQALGASQLAEYTGLPFTDVFERLRVTPELFSRLPRRPNRNTSYRLTRVVERMDAAATHAFINKKIRQDTQSATIALLIGAAVAVVVAYLSWD